MTGPYPPNHTVGSDRPGPQSRPFEYPGEHVPGAPVFGPGPGGPAGSPLPNYAGPPPPPPVGYPRRRSKRRLLVSILVTIALATVTTVAIVYGVRTNGANTGATFSEAAAKTAIQDYLNALDRRDLDVVMHNALCGMYDGVRDKRPDLALARLASDAFRKQFSRVEVTSIDKIVYLSQYQAQALFTMHASPTAGGPMRGQVQGIAQLLFQRGQILVCSYVLRTGGSY